jgi:cytochrome P450
MPELPPGPRSPAALQTLRWLTAPVAFMEDCRRRFGDAFSLDFLGFERPMVLLSDPAAIRELYGADHALPPGRTAALRPIMGPRSILLLEGDAHLERRRLMLPPFHGERMRSYERAIARIAHAEIDRWPRGEIALHPRMQAITFEVILEVVFGVTDPRRARALRELLPRLLDATASPVLSFRVLLARRLGRPDPLEAFAGLSARIDDVLLEEIRSRGASPRGQDVLSLLISARFEDGSAMDERELRDQLVTLLLAGHETTATALAWTFDLLTHSPAAMRRLRADLDAGSDAWLRATIAEALRLRPVLPLAGRRLRSELRTGGWVLPPGTDVSPAIWLTHTRADLYPEPFEFRPERFLDRGPSTYSWIPFGGGIRRCLGAAFAELEMRVVIEAVLSRVRLEPARPQPETVARRNLTFAPRAGTRVRVTALRPAAVAA